MNNGLPIAVFAALILATVASAGGTVTYTETADRLLQGDLDGIAVSSDGRLTLAPGVQPAAEGALPGAARAWSMTATEDGITYIGTGPTGTVYRIRPGVEPEALAVLPGPMVTALAVTADGTLLAAASPGGRIYRIAPDGSTSLWVETGERYVWDLVVSPEGQVFAATGENGILLEIDRRGSAETIFQARDPHLVRLLLHPRGGLLAGGGGRGMVYRINREGHGLSLYDDDLDQVTGIALEPDGSILAALMSAPAAVPGPAAVRFRIPGEASSAAPGSRVEVLEEPAAAVIEGRIEGLPAGQAGRPARTVGRVVRILPSGRSRELWSSGSETPLAMTSGGPGGVLFGSGSPARLYRCDLEGTTLLAELPEGQAGAMVQVRDRVAFTTSNPAVPYRVDWGRREAGVYLSPIRDAGRTSRWGAVHWRGSGLPGEVEIYTRTGNGPVPDRTWSAWSPARTIPGMTGGDSPDGRFLQWRLRIPGGAGGASVSDVSVACHPGNRPPVLESFRIAADIPPVPGAARFAWEAEDPDGDTPRITVEYTGTGVESWTTASLSSFPGGGTWNTSGIPEGRYRVRARAGDHHANSWQDGLWGDQPLYLSLVVDRSPPAVQVETGSDGLVLTATDELSPVLLVEVLAGGVVQYRGHPADGVADSTTERFLLPAAPADGPTDLSVKVRDAAGNVTEQAL